MDVNITLNGQPYAGRQINGYGEQVDTWRGADGNRPGGRGHTCTHTQTYTRASIGFIGNCSNPNDLYRHNASRGDDRFNMIWFNKENSNTTEVRLRGDGESSD